MKRFLTFLLCLASLAASSQNTADDNNVIRINKAQADRFVTSRIRTSCPRHTVRHCRQIDVYDNDIPQAFDGLRMAFITDIHYASRFGDKDLQALGSLLRTLNADVILLGGDYQEGCEYVEPLFKEIMSSHPRFGAFGVMGNNDYERCTDLIRKSMSDNGIKVLENATDSITINNTSVYIAGALNTFKARETTPCPTDNLKDTDFAILLTHTPDYVEDVECKNVDLALAGHLHGGQVTLFRLFAPVIPSHYGQRFRHGINRTTNGIPVLSSNGIGTSRKAIRFFAPAEVHVIVLHSSK